jgi:membrane-associated protease RseP (regulator of RpoE activity)
LLALAGALAAGAPACGSGDAPARDRPRAVDRDDDDDDARAGAAAAASAVPAAAVEPPPPLPLRITSADPTHYEIDADVVVEALVEALDGRITVRPARGRGAPGWELGAVAPGSLLARLGLGDGDVVRDANGLALAGASALSGVWAKARADGEIVLGVERAGAHVELRYKLLKHLRATGSGLSPLAPLSPLDLPPPPGDAAAGTGAAGARADLAALAAAEIHAIDATHFDVGRKLVRALADDPGSVALSVRIVPWVVDGTPRGMKLFGIRSTSPAHLLGIQNGDVVLSVNGKPLVSGDAILGLVSIARTANAFIVEIDRHGTPATLHWTVRED